MVMRRVRYNIKKSSGFLRCYVWLLLTKSVMQNQRYFENERESVCSIYLDAVWSWKTRKSVAMMHTIIKVKFLSKKFNFDKTPSISRVFHPKKNREFSREIKVEFLDKKWRFRTVCLFILSIIATLFLVFQDQTASK